MGDDVAPARCEHDDLKNDGYAIEDIGQISRVLR